MIFSDRTSVGSEKCFSPTDLLEYADSLLKEARQRERRTEERISNYGWLKSKHVHNEVEVDKDLDQLRPLIHKMTSESCAAVAVKLDNLTEESIVNSNDILTTFKKLIEEEDSTQMMDRNVKRAKETKDVKKRANKVHPELSPAGRQPTVSFIVDKVYDF